VFLVKKVCYRRKNLIYSKIKCNLLGLLLPNEMEVLEASFQVYESLNS